MSIEEISDYLLRPDCFVWVALRDATDDELTVMQGEFGLHDLAIEDARHGHQRPKIEEYGDTVFAVASAARPLDPGGLRALHVARIGSAAADCLARAVARAVHLAR